MTRRHIPVLCACIPPRTCRDCGCTDFDCSGCIARTGKACHWVEDDLCSACLHPKRQPHRIAARTDALVERAA